MRVQQGAVATADQPPLRFQLGAVAKADQKTGPFFRLLSDFVLLIFQYVSQPGHRIPFPLRLDLEPMITVHYIQRAIEYSLVALDQFTNSKWSQLWLLLHSIQLHRFYLQIQNENKGDIENQSEESVGDTKLRVLTRTGGARLQLSPPNSYNVCP